MNRIILEKIKERKRVDVILFTVALGFISLGCSDEFDDSSMAQLKKPEILSIVLSPPEIAPGESTRATVLIADQSGVIDNATLIWLPEFDLDDPGGRRRTGAGSVGFDTVDDIEALTQPLFEVTLDNDRNYDYDSDGFAEHTLGVLAFTDDFDLDRLLRQYKDLDLDALLGVSEIKLALRTILVSNRENKNRNPRVKGVRCHVADTLQALGATMVRSDDGFDEMESRRRSAIDNPIEVKAEAEVTFSVAVEDDDPIEEAILYQWISTGGDFGGRRKQKQKWTAPEYREPKRSTGEPSGDRNLDPTTDPNLYPVWVILRDSGIANRLGQSWAEFYLRVVRDDTS